jgi:hypothetical protein
LGPESNSAARAGTWSVQFVQEVYEEPEDSRCYANFDMSFFIARPGEKPPKGWNVIDSVRVENKKDLDKFLHGIEKGDSPVEEFALWPKTFELCDIMPEGLTVQRLTVVRCAPVSKQYFIFK